MSIPGPGGGGGEGLSYQKVGGASRLAQGGGGKSRIMMIMVSFRAQIKLELRPDWSV